MAFSFSAFDDSSLRLLLRVRLRMMEGYQKRRWLLRYLHSNKLALLPPYPPKWPGWTLLHPTGGLTPTCPEMLIISAWKERSKANDLAHGAAGGGNQPKTH